MGSLFGGKYSQSGNICLPIRETCLESSRKPTMEPFSENS